MSRLERRLPEVGQLNLGGGHPPMEPSASAECTVYLLRHGQTWFNSLDRIQGWCDSPLTPLGRDQATSMGARLRDQGLHVETAYCADMVRHYETATLALAEGEFDVVPARDARLREAAFGPWEGAKSTEMWDGFAARLGYPDARALFADVGVAEYLDLFDRLGETAGAADLPVETTREVGQRACAALDDIAEHQRLTGGGDVLVVSSGLTIVCVLRELGFNVANLTNPIGNGAVSVLRHDADGWSVLAVNQAGPVGASPSSVD